MQNARESCEPVTPPPTNIYSPEYRDYWRELLPDLWRWVEPRHYQMPSHFPAVTNSIGTGFHSLFFPDVRKPPEILYGERTRFFLQYQLSRHSVPTYLVGRELANALWRTRPPDELPLARLHFPYPAIRFVFEEGSLAFRSGHLATLEYAVLERGHVAAIPAEALGPHLEYLPRLRPPITISSRLMAVASGFRMNGSLKVSDRRTVSSEFTIEECVTIGDLLRRVPVEPNFYTEGHPYLPPMTDLPPATLGTLVNLLFFMTAKPELIEAEILDRPERRKHHRTIQALYTPHKIGTKFRLAALAKSNDAQSAKHKLAPGWRCGHWRDVAYGPQHSLRREQWIEPYPYGLDGGENGPPGESG